MFETFDKQKPYNIPGTISFSTTAGSAQFQVPVDFGFAITSVDVELYTTVSSKTYKITESLNTTDYYTIQINDEGGNQYMQIPMDVWSFLKWQRDTDNQLLWFLPRKSTLTIQFQQAIIIGTTANYTSTIYAKVNLQGYKSKADNYAGFLSESINIKRQAVMLADQAKQ